MSRFPRLRSKKLKPGEEIVALTNPHAGRGKDSSKALKEGTLKKLTEVFPGGDYRGQVVGRIRETEDLEDLDRAIGEMVENPPKLIIVLGGDGTVQKTIDRIIKRFVAAAKPIPMIMILGVGTVNAIRGALELLGNDPEKGRDRVFEKIRRGEPLDVIHRRVLKVNDDYGFIPGVGIVVRVLERYYLTPAPRGFWPALKTVAWAIWNEFARLLPPWRRKSIADRFGVRYELWSDDRIVLKGEGTASAVIASSVEQVGLGNKLTHRALEWPQHFHVIISNMGLWRSALNLPNMFLGAPLIGDVKDEIVTKAVLEFDRPMAYTIDGEMFDPVERLVIETGPLLDFVKS